MSVIQNALCSFDDIIEYMSDSYVFKSEDDTLIESIINYMTQTFHTYCGVEQFKSRQYTEYYNGNGTNKLFVYRKPIISVTSIYDDVDWVYGSDTLISSADYKIVNNLYIVYRDNIFTEGDQNIKITYTAGYGTIPNDLKHCFIKEVIRTFNRRSDFDVSAKTLGDGSITYVEKGILKATKEVLDAYRNIGIC